MVTGSVAFDYLMTFPERFLDVLVPDRMHRLSVSFRVDDMRRVRGGCAPNIAYSLARLGARPLIMAAAGSDAREYRDWLASAGVDVSLLKLHDDVFTASFFCTTDADQNQVGTFYSGAMDRARDLSFHDVDRETVAMAVVAPNDQQAMSRYTEECRQLRIPFMYDPSQQVARLEREELLSGLEGAAIFIGNEYEFGIIEKKTGLDSDGAPDACPRAHRHPRRRRLDDLAARAARPAARGRSGCRPPGSRRASSTRRASATPIVPGCSRRAWRACRGTSPGVSAAWRRCTRSRPSGRSRAPTRSPSSGSATRRTLAVATRRSSLAWEPERRLAARVQTSPALSVVIPVFDEVECLDALVRDVGAVLDALGRSAEIVAVDDGSTDGSFERLVALGAVEPRLRVVRLQRNYGQTAALAAGIEPRARRPDRDPGRRPAERPARHPAAARGARRRTSTS